MSKQASDQDQASLVRSEHADQKMHIDDQNASFAPDLPESLPKLHVPGLSPDATSLPPEALSGQVPTLTDSVVPHAAPAPEPSELKLASMPDPEPDPIEPTQAQDHSSPVIGLAPVVPAEPPSEPFTEPEPESDAVVQTPPTPLEETVDVPANELALLDEETPEESATQEVQAEADTWVEQMQVRMEKLTEEIHLLNDRLDRFEKLPKV